MVLFFMSCTAYESYDIDDSRHITTLATSFIAVEKGKSERRDFQNSRTSLDREGIIWLEQSFVFVEQ